MAPQTSTNVYSGEISQQNQGPDDSKAKNKSDKSSVCTGRWTCTLILLLWFILVVSLWGDDVLFYGGAKGKLRSTNMGFPNVLQTKVGSNISPLKSSYKKALPSPASAIDAALKFMRDCTAQQRGEKIAATIPILCVALEGAIFWSNKLYINVDVNPGVLMYTSWYIGKEASRGSTMDGNSNNNINNNSENESSSASSISPLQREIFEVLKMNYINLHNITRQNIYYSNVKRRESSISNISKYLYKSHGLPKAFPFEREQRNYLTPIEVYWVTMANENKGGCDANNNNNIPNRRPSHSSSAHTNQGNATNSVMYKTTDVSRTLPSSESSPTVLDSTNATVLPPLCTGRLFPHISSLITQQTDKGNHRNNINNNNYPLMYMAPANTIGYYQSHIVGAMYVNMWHVFAYYFGMIFHTVWDVVRGSVDGKYDVMWVTRSPRPGSKRYIHWSKPKPLPLFGFFVSFFKRNYVIIDDPDHIYSVVEHGGGDPPNIVLPESEINRSNIIRTMFSTTPQSHNNDGKLIPRSNITVNTTRDKSNDTLQTKKDSIALHFNILLLGLKNSCSAIHDHIDTMECRNNIWTMRNHILRDMYGLDPNKRVCMRQENTDSVSQNKHIVENNNNIVNITALSKNINKSINTTDVPVITKSDCSNATFIVHAMDRQKATYRRIYPYYQTIESITSAVSKYFTTPNRYSATTGRNMTLPANSFIKEGVKYQIANIRLHRGMSFREQIMTVYNSSMLFAGRGAGTALCLFLPIGGGYLSVSVQDRWNPYMDLSLWWLTIHHHKATLVHHSNSQLPPKRFGKKKAVDFNRAGYLVIPHEVESSVTGLLKAMGASLYMNVSLVG